MKKSRTANSVFHEAIKMIAELFGSLNANAFRYLVGALLKYQAHAAVEQNLPKLASIIHDLNVFEAKKASKGKKAKLFYCLAVDW